MGAVAEEYMETGVAYDPSKLTGIHFFVLNSNTIYCSIMLANRNESEEFIKTSLTN
jgi:hypothetical protein